MSGGGCRTSAPPSVAPRASTAPGWLTFGQRTSDDVTGGVGWASRSDRMPIPGCTDPNRRRDRMSARSLRLPVVMTAVALLFLIAPSAALAAGPAVPSDFDGDGYADLAIGVALEDVGTARDAGLVNVLYGGPKGLSAAGDQAWSQDSPGIKGTSEGPKSSGGDGFGWALASGDFDKDGRADLAIGVPFDRVGTTKHAGAVNVLYGSPKGLADGRDQLWTQAELPGEPAAGNGFGQALAVG